MNGSYLPEVPHSSVDAERVGCNSRDAAFSVVPQLSQRGGRSGSMDATRRRRFGLRTLSYYPRARQRRYYRWWSRARTAWCLCSLRLLLSRLINEIIICVKSWILNSVFKWWRIQTGRRNSCKSKFSVN